MALQISKPFKDISLSFSRHPVTNDISVLKNEDAIKKSVINLIKTEIGERFYNKLIGSTVSKSLFELSNIEISSTLEKEIQVLLENYEPRIKIIEIKVSSIIDSYELDVYLNYEIVGLPIPQQNVTFLLQPTRI